jgi:hypothetical protein
VPRRLAPGSLAHHSVLPAGLGRHPAVVVYRKDTLAELPRRVSSHVRSGEREEEAIVLFVGEVVVAA